MAHDTYTSPFQTRYASKEMQYIFSEDNKFKTWRRLWIALAKAEQKQGLPITDAQIAELEAHKDDINYDVAAAREKECRHDVMSHVYAYGVQCPEAKGIIHLGATSCYVGDNTDILVMREALEVVRRKLLNVMALLAEFADEYKAMPALAYTHLQPAQLTTVGKRAALWLGELYMDYAEIETRIKGLALLGSKGTTGTQASFVELFEGDDAKIKAVEADIAAALGFEKVVPVSGQTYSRKVDYNVLSALSGVAQSAMKFGNDMRLLANFKEMEEPFEKNQIGSSAMPYKRNPMRCERICALARYVMIDVLNPAFTAGTQWFERTLDDSANKRVAVAEGFISMKPETLALIVEGKAAKGDVLACARVAGVMAAKKTSELIPMCHPLNITKAKVECAPVREGEREDGRVGIHVTTTCGVTGKTGIEMEALTAASVTCLTVYDMCKAVDRGMEISDVRLLKKDGGKTGLWLREE